MNYVDFKYAKQTENNRTYMMSIMMSMMYIILTFFSVILRIMTANIKVAVTDVTFETISDALMEKSHAFHMQIMRGTHVTYMCV